nr:hypothetical protein PanWU01x14_047200 [Ipomoea batatas]GMC62472.1 hypothetical protein PanWU01x14_047200 [Ipomoea batatas]
MATEELDGVDEAGVEGASPTHSWGPHAPLRGELREKSRSHHHASHGDDGPWWGGKGMNAAAIIIIRTIILKSMGSQMIRRRIRLFPPAGSQEPVLRLPDNLIRRCGAGRVRQRQLRVHLLRRGGGGGGTVVVVVRLTVAVVGCGKIESGGGGYQFIDARRWGRRYGVIIGRANVERKIRKWIGTRGFNENPFQGHVFTFFFSLSLSFIYCIVFPLNKTCNYGYLTFPFAFSTKLASSLLCPQLLDLVKML